MKRMLLLALIAPTACAMPGMEMRAPAMAGFEREAEPTGTAAEPPRRNVREFFPESLLWRPEVITDEDGRASVAFPLGDSITTWRVSAVASAADGRLGFGGARFRTFREFFVEPDVPPVLTQGDRIGLPVAIYNFLDLEQQVAVCLEPDDWYEAPAGTERTLRVGPRQASAVTFEVVARRLGTHRLGVRAIGDREGSDDTVRRAVTVWPDGRERTRVLNASVSGRATLSLDAVPDALPGTARLLVKAYPGVSGSVLDGLEAMLRKPHG